MKDDYMFKHNLHFHKTSKTYSGSTHHKGINIGGFTCTWIKLVIKIKKKKKLSKFTSDNGFFLRKISKPHSDFFEF